MDLSQLQSVDAQLLQRIAQRDEDALAELYDRYAPVLYSLALRMLRAVDDAEGILEDVFARVWNRTESFQRESENVFVRLVKLVHEHAIHRVQSVASHRQVQPDDLPGFTFAIGDHPEKSRTPQEFDVHRAAVLRALKELTSEQLRILGMSYVGGFTPTDIARELHSTPDGVKFLLNEAMQTIHARIHRTE